MIKVLIIKNWTQPDLFRQSPKGEGVWDDIQFTFDTHVKCDYVVVLNYSPKIVKLLVPPENIWCIIQEPPNEYFRYRHKANKIYYRVFTQDQSLSGERYIYSQPALPWHVDKSYDTLKKFKPSEKTMKLSCITSNKRNFQGQKERMDFIDNIKKKLQIDIFGKGINPIKDKWDGLYPYRYSLIIENFKGPDYWSEKLADCFLAWTMPIYYGCTNIDDYFPKESLVKIDISNPDVFQQIEEIISSDLWEKRQKAISHSRDLILEKYQFFPFIVSKIKEWEKDNRNKSNIEEVVIPNENTFLLNNSIIQASRELIDSAIKNLARRINK